MIDGFEIGQEIDRKVAAALKSAPPNKKNRPQYDILLWRLDQARDRIRERLARAEAHQRQKSSKTAA